VIKNDRDGLNWRKGIAFVRGINVYGSKRISKMKIFELCKSVEDENLRIIKVVRGDNIVFEKRGIHYATVSLRIEKVLSEHFKKRVYVTSRSIKTIKFLAKV